MAVTAYKAEKRGGGGEGRGEGTGGGREKELLDQSDRLGVRETSPPQRKNEEIALLESIWYEKEEFERLDDERETGTAAEKRDIRGGVRGRREGDPRESGGERGGEKSGAVAVPPRKNTSRCGCPQTPSSS